MMYTAVGVPIVCGDSIQYLVALIYYVGVGNMYLFSWHAVTVILTVGGPSYCITVHLYEGRRKWYWLVL